MILSVYQAELILKAYESDLESVEISLDLGLSKSNVLIKNDEFIFPDGQKLRIDDIKKIIKKDTSCFVIKDNAIEKIQYFSEKTNNYYKLFPTKSWPTIEISGIRMHVVKAFTPEEDTKRKIGFIAPCSGKVLDTCTGLGYTAIMAAKTCDEVQTYEIDENCIALERINPHSRELFSNQKITRHEGDIFIEIKKLKNSYFDRVIHDPPRLALSTLLYSQEFYNELCRVMKKGAKFYHYTGDPGHTKGQDIRQGITKRLARAGFSDIIRVFNGLAGEK
jgi:predicted methyltransferase